eukprot:gene16937-biopygen2095
MGFGGNGFRRGNSGGTKFGEKMRRFVHAKLTFRVLMHHHLPVPHRELVVRDQGEYAHRPSHVHRDNDRAGNRRPAVRRRQCRPLQLKRFFPL